jgi:hypothetical protein
MKVSYALAAAALLVLLVIPAGAQTIYPTQRCRVYDDTAFIQIPGQCGTLAPYHPRRLFVRSPRRPLYHYYRDYC